ncbi:MAG TPA: glycoside hydrolase family 31 protein [Chitinophagales bacterium]|nr:glycoside hydrolase family 31 protein [Chitinophagales bacterium]HRK28213.1 glycoside hydrolase family 31 protein [Chitinophagales bacterium]
MQQTDNIAHESVHKRYDDVVRRHFPGRLIAFEQTDAAAFSLQCENKVTLLVNVITDTIIRFRYSIDGEFDPDFSYALNPQFTPQPPTVHYVQTEHAIEIYTGKLCCVVSKHRLLLRIYDLNGNAICEDDTGFYLRESILEGITEVKVTKKAPLGKMYLGLGDKPHLSNNLRGKAFENWCTDASHYQADTDAIYRAIPFYYALHNQTAYGIFLDNTYRTRFSFDRQGNQVSSFSAAGGDINYYFIYGPQLQHVATQYTQLTGTAALPPLWALGYHQCRWSYYPESHIRQIAEEFRQRQIPCDALYFDIDYMDGYRCFTWDKSRFPNPKQLLADLKTQGFKPITIIDPGILIDKDYAVYQSGTENDVWCRRDNGKLMRASVWPPECVFPDFTNPQVRKWWGTLHNHFYTQLGVSGFWNDMNEPAIFEVKRKTFPDHVRHHYDGHACSHQKAHNVYGMQMSRATQEGLTNLNPQKRPFVITRASYAGGQRYACCWTGDNSASWEHLQIANLQCQRMSISGFSFIGSDIGGFSGITNAELFVRWLQLGAFHLFFRTHSMGANADVSAYDINQKPITDREPWVFGEPYTSIAKATIEMRYQLLPYLYTAFWQYHTTGTPVIKPLSFYDQTDPVACKREIEFLVGDHILVRPVIKPTKTTARVYLPKGNWYHYYTDHLLAGNQKHRVDAPLHHIPFFVKEGAVIPHFPVMQYVGEKLIDQLTLHLYFAPNTTQSHYYEDEGENLSYLLHNYLLHTFVNKGNEHSVNLTHTTTGNFTPAYTTIKLALHGLPFTPVACLANGQKIAINRAASVHKPVYEVILPARFTTLTVQ